MLFRVRKASLVGRWLALTPVLLALAIQAFIVQTHIHTPAEAERLAWSIALQNDASVPAAEQSKDTKGGSHDRYPPGQDPANCPLCREIVHAGHYLATPAPVLIAPAGTAEIAPIHDGGVLAGTPSLPWDARGPPAA